MEIKGPGNFPALNLTELRQLASSPEAGKVLAAARVSWQTGQLLNALVVSQDSESLLLNVQGQAVLVKNRPEFAFLPGQKLTLQVEQLTPAPAMKLIAPLPRPLAGSEQMIMQQAMRQDMTRQAPLPPLLANLATVARQPDQHPPLPAAIRKTAWQIHQLLPEPAQASRPESLQRALERIAPMLENQLLQLSRGEAAPRPDQTLQGALLRLADQLRQALAASAPRPQPGTGSPPGTTAPAGTPAAQLATGSLPAAPSRPAETGQGSAAVRPQTPQAQPQSPPSLQGLTSQEQGLGELLRQVEGGLARMQLHQLHSLQSEQAGRPMWAMELPIRAEQGVDLFDLRISRDPEEHEGEEYRRPWQVSLAFDLDGLGPVQVHLTLLEQTVSAHFQMAEDTTRQLFDNALDQLRSRLHGAGLEVGQLECASGIDTQQGQTIARSGLLDEKA